MRQPPLRPDAPLLDRAAWGGIVQVGLLQSAVALTFYLWALHAHGEAVARALVFTEVIVAEVLRAFAVRSDRLTLWEVGAFGNPWLVLAGASTVALQIAIQTLEPVRRLFQLAPVSAAQGALALAVGLLPVTLLELAKLVQRALARNRGAPQGPGAERGGFAGRRPRSINPV
jgi:magnesium-transporting ATPase (P-type)